MTDSYNREIDHRHQPTNIPNAKIRHKTITETITEIHRLKETTIRVVPDGMKINNTTGEDITDHLRHSVMVINITKIEITSPDINLMIDRMRDRVTIVEAVTEVNHHVGACSPTAGRRKIIKAVTGHVKEPKKPSRIQDTLKMSNVIADVTHAPMMCHALQANAGQLQ